ncbi:MAG: hypothetical protein FVQ83_12425 [Chloroflexi bacterium]|nr:hypothetical protein [Chloroflexota bacterium]
MNDPKNQIEPALKDLLEQFMTAPERNRLEAERGKTRFLADAQQIQERSFLPLSERIYTWIKSIFNTPNKKTFSLRFRLTILTVSILLLGGISGTAYAAQDALPGDLLYPVKNWVEDAWLIISLDEAGDTWLRLEFAQNRLEEISLLRQEKPAQDIELAFSNFNKNIQAAGLLLQNLEDNDNPQTESLSIVYAHLLAEYQSLMVDESKQAPAADESPPDDGTEEEGTTDEVEIDEEQNNGENGLEEEPVEKNEPEEEGESEEEESEEEESGEEGSGGEEHDEEESEEEYGEEEPEEESEEEPERDK